MQQQQHYLECLWPRFLCVFSFVTGNISLSLLVIQITSEIWLTKHLQVHHNDAKTLLTSCQIFLQEWSRPSRTSQVEIKIISKKQKKTTNIAGDYRPRRPLTPHTSFSHMHPGPNFVLEIQKKKKLIELEELLSCRLKLSNHSLWHFGFQYRCLHFYNNHRMSKTTYLPTSERK